MNTRHLIALAALAGVLLAIATPPAHAACETHNCWHRVHVHRLEQMLETKIARITPYRCFGQRVVTPCWVIAQESRMDDFWLALNGGHNHPDARTPCAYRACGIYQLLGPEKHAPWPVIVTAHMARAHRWLSARYETLKRQLAHHRIARSLPMSAWGG